MAIRVDFEHVDTHLPLMDVWHVPPGAAPLRGDLVDVDGAWHRVIDRVLSHEGSDVTCMVQRGG